jgi:hypothetical protein
MERKSYEPCVLSLLQKVFDLSLCQKSESWILALTALASMWNSFQFSYMNALACWPLAHCTVTASLCVHYFYWEHDYTHKPIPSDIRAKFSPQLGQSLIQAAANARNTQPEFSPALPGGTLLDGFPDMTPSFERIVELLEALGGKINTEFEPTSGEVRVGGATKRYRDWEELQKHFEAELDVLEESLLA